MKRRMAKRYSRIEGVDFTVGSPNAMRVAIGGVWMNIPKSVIHSYDLEKHEIVLEEWWAKQKSLA